MKNQFTISNGKKSLPLLSDTENDTYIPFTNGVININKDQYEVKDNTNSEVKQKLDKEEENLMINLRKNLDKFYF